MPPEKPTSYMVLLLSSFLMLFLAGPMCGPKVVALFCLLHLLQVLQCHKLFTFEPYVLLWLSRKDKCSCPQAAAVGFDGPCITNLLDQILLLSSGGLFVLSVQHTKMLFMTLDVRPRFGVTWPFFGCSSGLHQFSLHQDVAINLCGQRVKFTLKIYRNRTILLLKHRDTWKQDNPSTDDTNSGSTKP